MMFSPEVFAIGAAALSIPEPATASRTASTFCWLASPGAIAMHSRDRKRDLILAALGVENQTKILSAQLDGVIVASRGIIAHRSRLELKPRPAAIA